MLWNVPVATVVVLQHEVNVVILRLSAHSETSSLQSWEEYSDKFAKARRVENSDSLCCAARGVVRVDAASRH
jgi:hypothetical protein